MTIEYYTTVEPSEGFWQQLVSNQLNYNYPIRLIGEDVGFTITREDIPAIRTMIVLSENFPEETFKVTITTNDLYNNLIERYEITSGTTFLIDLEPIYHFVCSEGTIPKVDPIILNHFKEEIIEALNRLAYYEASIERLRIHPNRQEERVSNISFEYGKEGRLLTATVKGSTFIEINSEGYIEDYDPLPF